MNMQIVDGRFEREFARRLQEELDEFDIPVLPLGSATRSRLPFRTLVLALAVALAVSAVGVISASADPTVKSLWHQTMQSIGIDTSPGEAPTPEPESQPSRQEERPETSATSEAEPTEGNGAPASHQPIEPTDSASPDDSHPGSTATQRSSRKPIDGTGSEAG